MNLNTKTPGQLHHRNDLHLARKTFHILGGVTLLYFFLVIETRPIVIAGFLSTFLIIITPLELLRIRWAWLKNLAAKTTALIMRKNEFSAMTGIPFYLAGCLFAILVFPKHIAALSILYLVFGDPASSLFGVLFGREKLFPNKSLQGTMAGFFICAIATLVYAVIMSFDPSRIYYIAVVGGLIGTAAEMAPVPIDDNFSIPIISGLSLWFLFWMADLPLA